MQNILEIENLHVEVDDKEILRGVNLNIEPGKIHVIMGPNGSGKSSLAMTLMGHPKYHVSDGVVKFDGKELLSMSTEERSHNGLFLSFQQPNDIKGVSLSTYLRTIYNFDFKRKNPQENPPSVFKFKKILKEKAAELDFNPIHLDYATPRGGFSGGEKKKLEMLQMALLEPKLCMLDEIDSGLDVDALRSVCAAINQLHRKTKMTLLIVTHYTRILRYLIPDRIHVLKEGRIIKSGDSEFADELEEKGYECLLEKCNCPKRCVCLNCPKSNECRE